MTDIKPLSDSNNPNDQSSLSERYLDSLIKFSTGSLNSKLLLFVQHHKLLILYSNISTSGNFG